MNTIRNLWRSLIQALEPELIRRTSSGKAAGMHAVIVDTRRFSYDRTGFEGR